jgi:hypothetical protein
VVIIAAARVIAVLLFRPGGVGAGRDEKERCGERLLLYMLIKMPAEVEERSVNT